MILRFQCFSLAIYKRSWSIFNIAKKISFKKHFSQSCTDVIKIKSFYKNICNTYANIILNVFFRNAIVRSLSYVYTFMFLCPAMYEKRFNKDTSLSMKSLKAPGNILTNILQQSTYM